MHIVSSSFKIVQYYRDLPLGDSPFQLICNLKKIAVIHRHRISAVIAEGCDELRPYVTVGIPGVISCLRAHGGQPEQFMQRST
jgi:hypothetical protein